MYLCLLIIVACSLTRHFTVITPHFDTTRLHMRYSLFIAFVGILGGLDASPIKKCPAKGDVGYPATSTSLIGYPTLPTQSVVKVDVPNSTTKGNHELKPASSPVSPLSPVSKPQSIPQSTPSSPSKKVYKPAPVKTETVMTITAPTILSHSLVVDKLIISSDFTCPDSNIAFSITAKRIQVKKGGRFVCGTREKPFMGQLVVTLSGNPDVFGLGEEKEEMAFEVLDGGEIRIHGEDAVSWTELAKTAKVGDSLIELVHSPVGWAVSLSLVIRRVYGLGG